MVPHHEYIKIHTLYHTLLIKFLLLKNLATVGVSAMVIGVLMGNKALLHTNANANVELLPDKTRFHQLLSSSSADDGVSS